MRAPSDEHKVIWLEPSCGEENTEGRQWCQDNVWGDTCDGCEAKPVKFIRADLVEEIRATLDATRKLITEAALTGSIPTDGTWAERLFKNQGRIFDALKQ